MLKKRIMSVVGTRPEGIKMAPVILALGHESWVEQTIISSGQHQQMLEPILNFFGISCDDSLEIMRPGQSLASLSARALEAMDAAIEAHQPDCVIVQGDTTTAAMAALAAFYRRIPVAHVEAGLRTYDLQNPFPEELNRLLIGRIAALHFAPTQGAANALLAEGVAAAKTLITGNSVIDALHLAVDKSPALPFDLPDDRRIILITLHRRENFGDSITQVCAAIEDILLAVPDAHIVWPVHLNPQVKGPVETRFADHSRVRLCGPLSYPAFVAMMHKAHIILTDSGGVQEEAPALAKPVLVLRDTTERPEAVTMGVVELTGTNRMRIATRAIALMTDPSAYQDMARGISPYGDGKAAGRIVKRLKSYLL